MKFLESNDGAVAGYVTLNAPTSTRFDRASTTAGETAQAAASSLPAVRALTPSDVTSWNAFVVAQPDGTFFHRAEWRDVLTRAFGHRTHYLLAEANGRIVGVLPLAEVRSALFGHSLISTPFCVYGGIVADRPAAHAALTEAACRLARELGVDYLEMRNRWRQYPDWPVKDTYVTFRKPIDADPEKNMLAIPRKQRAMVRKGLKAGLAAEIDTDVDRLYRLYSESLRNLGTPVFSRRYVETLREVFSDDCEILTVVHGGAAVASCLSFYFRDEVLPYYGGGTSLARSVAGNDFMYWEVMERARERGKRLFDYGRSRRGAGSGDFKRNWGFEAEPLCYEYYLVKRKEMPNLSPANPTYGRAIDIWRRLPLKVTQVLGPPVAKYLG